MVKVLRNYLFAIPERGGQGFRNVHVHCEMSEKNGSGGIKQILERIFSLPLIETEKFGLRAGPCFDLPKLSIPENEVDRRVTHKEICIEQCKVIEILILEE